MTKILSMLVLINETIDVVTMLLIVWNAFLQNIKAHAHILSVYGLTIPVLTSYILIDFYT